MVIGQVGIEVRPPGAGRNTTGPGLSEEELINRFSYHPPGSPEDVAAYQRIRDAQLVLARLVVAHAADSRELSLALTSIDEVGFWANAARARRGPASG